MRLLFQTSLLAIACCLTGQAICQQVDELQSTRVKAREPLNVGTNAQLGDYKHKFTTSDRRQELSFRDNTYFFLISQKQDLSKFAGVYRRKDKAKIAALPPTAKKLVTGALSFNQVSFMEILKDGFSVALTSTKALVLRLCHIRNTKAHEDPDGALARQTRGTDRSRVARAQGVEIRHRA